MAVLIGTLDDSNHTSTKAIQSLSNAALLWQDGVAGDPNNVNQAGVARNLWIKVSSWGTQTTLKACIYDQGNAGALVEEVLFTSAQGTGLISSPMAGTLNIQAGRRYSIGFYTPDNQAVTLNIRPGVSGCRQDLSGNFTNPADPWVDGSWDQTAEMYWMIDDEQASSFNPVWAINANG